MSRKEVRHEPEFAKWIARKAKTYFCAQNTFALEIIERQ